MKVIVDQDRCAASGQCVLTVPDVFDQREEDGVVVLLNQNPPVDLADRLQRAATTCPSQAITVGE